MTTPPDPQEVYALISRWLAFLEPGELFERVQLTARAKSGRVIFHTVPVTVRDESGLTAFQRRCLDAAKSSPIPLKRAEIVRRATHGRGKASGRYGVEVAELVTSGKLKSCHRVYYTDDLSKCPKHAP